MSKNTPWRNNGAYIENSNNETVAQAFRVIGSDWIETGETARLIAAAPDLLAALQTCIGFIEDAHILEAQWGWDPIGEANRAISKATGAAE